MTSSSGSGESEGVDVATAYGGWSPEWRSSITPNQFIKARSKTSRPGYLTPLTAGDIPRSSTMYLSKDGKVGFILTKDGEIENGFNNRGPVGAFTEALLHGIAAGGTHLDCFDPYLPSLYTQFGFIETGRMKFNEDDAPPGWDFERDDNPDVVFMALQKEVGNDNQIRERVRDASAWLSHAISSRYYTNYQEAKEDARTASRPRSGSGGKR